MRKSQLLFQFWVLFVPKFMSSTANTDDDIIDPQLLDSSELPIIFPYIPTLPEALNLTPFFQSMSISTLDFLIIFLTSDLLHTMSQAPVGLKHHQRTKKIQTSLKDFWSSGLAN